MVDLETLASLTQPEKPSFDSSLAPVVKSGGTPDVKKASVDIDESRLRYNQRRNTKLRNGNWKQWQANGGDMSNMGNYQQYVAGAR